MSDSLHVHAAPELPTPAASADSPPTNVRVIHCTDCGCEGRHIFALLEVRASAGHANFWSYDLIRTTWAPDEGGGR